MNRTFLQQAKIFSKQDISSWWMSEKLDGMRVLWDGGVTRGLPKEEVPWANTDKDDRLVKDQVATGLWTRYGNVIHAPDYWLDSLPNHLFEGELWIGREVACRQLLMSTVKKLVPDDNEWDAVTLRVLDSPPVQQWLMPGLIKDGKNYTKRITRDMLDWYETRAKNVFYLINPGLSFRQRHYLLGQFLKDNPSKYCFLHEQKQLHWFTSTSIDQVEKEMEQIVSLKGEGLVIKHPDREYNCRRVGDVLKYKSCFDSEGLIVGFNSGEGEDIGMLGSIEVQWGLINFKISASSCTDKERQLDNTDYAIKNPGKRLPGEVKCLHFTRGDKITFKYRSLSRDGVPQEAAYFRKWEEI